MTTMDDNIIKHVNRQLSSLKLISTLPNYLLDIACLMGMFLPQLKGSSLPISYIPQTNSGLTFYASWR